MNVLLAVMGIVCCAAAVGIGIILWVVSLAPNEHEDYE